MTDINELENWHSNAIFIAVNTCAVPYELQMHKKVLTTRDAAIQSKTALCKEIKTLVLKHEFGFVAVTIKADQRLNFVRFAEYANCNKLQFASLTELQKMDLELGAIAPFGFPSNVKAYVSDDVLKIDKIHINPGSNQITMGLYDTDFAEICQFFSVEIVPVEFVSEVTN